MKVHEREQRLLQSSSSSLLESALKCGAQSAEVCSSYVMSTKISLEKQDFHLTSTDEGFRLGLRIIKDGKQGFSSCNTTEAKELREVASKAVQIASFSPENPYNKILPSQNTPSAAPDSPFDTSLGELSLQTQKDWAKLLREEALKDPRFKINDGSVEIVSSFSMVLNSTGVHKSESDAFCSWGLMGMGVSGSDITSFDAFHWISRKVKTAPELIKSTTRDFSEKVLSGLKVGEPKSYKGIVILSPRAVIDILLEGLVYHLNGRNLVEGTTKWRFLDVGKKILNEQISLADTPWKVDRTGFSLFDREGTPTSDRALISRGTLNGYLLDHYSATALGSSSTGNAAGGPAALPSVSSHCLKLGEGSLPLKEFCRKAETLQKEYLLVHRYSGQVDPVTGDFSGVAKGAKWCRNGEPQYSVKETLIAGNFFESMGSALIALSKDTEVINSGDEAPYALIDNVSVTTHAP